MFPVLLHACFSPHLNVALFYSPRFQRVVWKHLDPLDDSGRRLFYRLMLCAIDVTWPSHFWIEGSHFELMVRLTQWPRFSRITSEKCSCSSQLLLPATAATAFSKLLLKALRLRGLDVVSKPLVDSGTRSIQLERSLRQLVHRQRVWKIKENERRRRRSRGNTTTTHPLSWSSSNVAGLWWDWWHGTGDEICQPHPFLAVVEWTLLYRSPYSLFALSSVTV